MFSIFTKEKSGEEKKVNENKKKLENLVLITILLIIVIVVMNVPKKEEKNDVEKAIPSQVEYNQLETEETLEERMERILSYIAGAGSVDVLITYKNGIEQVPMYNTKQNTVITEEADNAGGTRKTEETNEEQSIVFKEEGSEKTPVVKQTINPEIIGVIVVAEGAESLSVKENLIKAVEATLDVPSHRIQVFARKK